MLHISGTPGAGKTTIGKWIKRTFRNVDVYDLDVVRDKTIAILEKRDARTDEIPAAMQRAVDTIIQRSKDKGRALIFVGLNMPDPRVWYKGKWVHLRAFTLSMRDARKIYLDPEPDQLVRQHLRRELQRRLRDLDFIVQNKQTINLSVNDMYKEAAYFRALYKRKGYEMVSPEKIKIYISEWIQAHTP